MEYRYRKLKKHIKNSLQVLTTDHTSSSKALSAFLEFERNCKSEMRGGVKMYDIKGYYKWLTFTELYSHYVESKSHHTSAIEADRRIEGGGC